MLQTLTPFSVVFLTIGPEESALSVTQVHVVVSFVLLTVFGRVDSVPVHLAVLPVANVLVSISPSVGALTIALIVDIRSFEDFSRWPLVDSWASSCASSISCNADVLLVIFPQLDGCRLHFWEVRWVFDILRSFCLDSKQFGHFSGLSIDLFLPFLIGECFELCEVGPENTFDAAFKLVTQAIDLL